MPLIEKNRLGQLLFMGISGEELSFQEEKFISDYQVAGVILFGRNLKNPEQILKLCKKLKSLTSEPLWIGVDMEGGRVHRLKPPFTQWPALFFLERAGEEKAYEMAHAMGKEMAAVGMNLDFTPCLDLRTNPQNKIIADRSLGTEPEKVLALAKALVKGYKDAGIFCCSKHFPGHGDTFVDSHEELPKEKHTLSQLEKRELLCYKDPLTEMIMTAHILFENVDSKNPVTLSSLFLKDVLRHNMGYKGLIISDDLDMKALSLHFQAQEIPIRALKAGCDLLLYCNEPAQPQKAMDVLEEHLQKDDEELFSSIEDSRKRLHRVKQSFFQKKPPLKEKTLSIIGSSSHQELACFLKNKDRE